MSRGCRTPPAVGRMRRAVLRRGRGIIASANSVIFITPNWRSRRGVGRVWRPAALWCIAVWPWGIGLSWWRRIFVVCVVGSTIIAIGRGRYPPVLLVPCTSRRLRGVGVTRFSSCRRWATIITRWRSSSSWWIVIEISIAIRRITSIILTIGRILPRV